MENVFYFTKNGLFVLEIIKWLYFTLHFFSPIDLIGKLIETDIITCLIRNLKTQIV